jgi:putative ABC transport system permease protein
MRLRSAFSLGLRRLRQRPIRTILLLQGTIWGVAVAIFPSAVIGGTREAALTEGARLGADRIAIAADPTSAQRAALDLRDLDAVRAAAARAGLAPSASGGVRIRKAVAHPTNPAGRGTLTWLDATPGVEAARGLDLAAGRWLAPEDGPDRCVVEAGVASWLGRTTVAPGDRIRLPGEAGELEIVGVAAARTPQVLRTTDLGFDLEHPLYEKVTYSFLLAMGIPLVQDDWKRTDRCIYVPAQAREGELDWLFLRADTRDVSTTAELARDTLALRDKAAVTLYPLLLPFVLGEEVDRFAAVNLAMFLACLCMGAVVMMNLGLLNVLTRSREIAVRRTEGATQGDIARQFLAEGFLLSLVGSGLGCLLGMGLAELRTAVEPAAGVTWSFPEWQAAAATAVALIVGVLASLLPAVRAGRLDPVEGLADE